MKEEVYVLCLRLSILAYFMAFRKANISEFEASLVYKVSSRTARGIQRNPVLKEQNKTKQNKTKQNKTKKSKYLFKTFFFQYTCYFYLPVRGSAGEKLDRAII
jgi:hypothetical protein